MTTTPIIREGFTGEIITFKRDTPDDLGNFVKLVTGCEVVSSDPHTPGYGFSVQIDPVEMHVQVEFPPSTNLDDAETLLGNLVVIGAMESEAPDSDLAPQRSIDERFKEIVERIGKEDSARRRITDLATPALRGFDVERLPRDEPDLESRCSPAHVRAMLKSHGDDVFRSFKPFDGDGQQRQFKPINGDVQERRFKP